RFGVSSSPSRLGSSPSSAKRFLISSCILLFYISALAGSMPRQTGDQPDPDRLYADRANVTSAARAAEIWTAMLARDADAFDAAWRLARVCYWLGSHAPAQQRRGYLERGIEAGRQAAALQPARAEGHFWTAADMGALAESFGLRAGLKYRKPVKEELEAVLRIDAGFQQ